MKRSPIQLQESPSSGGSPPIAITIWTRWWVRRWPRSAGSMRSGGGGATGGGAKRPGEEGSFGGGRQRPSDLGLEQKSANRLAEGAQQPAALAGERGRAELAGAIGDHQRRIVAGLLGKQPGEAVPADLALVGEMPQPGLAVDQEVERGMAEIGNEGRRDEGARAGAHPLAAAEPIERLPGEIVDVPGAEKGAGADDQRRSAGLLDRAFGRGFAGAVDAGRARRIAFTAGAAERAVEDEVGGEGQQRNARARAGGREQGGTFCVGGHAGLPLPLGVGDADEAGRIDDRPGTVPV